MYAAAPLVCDKSPALRGKPVVNLREQSVVLYEQVNERRVKVRPAPIAIAAVKSHLATTKRPGKN